jgi:hypothetical protein
MTLFYQYSTVMAGLCHMSPRETKGCPPLIYFEVLMTTVFRGQMLIIRENMLLIRAKAPYLLRELKTSKTCWFPLYLLFWGISNGTEGVYMEPPTDRFLVSTNQS